MLVNKIMRKKKEVGPQWVTLWEGNLRGRASNFSSGALQSGYSKQDSQKQNLPISLNYLGNSKYKFTYLLSTRTKTGNYSGASVTINLSETVPNTSPIYEAEFITTPQLTTYTIYANDYNGAFTSIYIRIGTSRVDTLNNVYYDAYDKYYATLTDITLLKIEEFK